MKLFNLLFIYSILFVCGCQTNNQDNGDLLQIDIDMEHMESISSTELFEEITLIPLATTDSILLGICYPIFTDSCYFMRDNSQQELSVFKSNGEFKFKISNQGKGPQKYSYLTGICYNPFSQEIILLDLTNKVHIYDINGQFIENRRIDSCMNIGNILPISADTLLIIDGHEFSDYYIYAYGDNQVVNRVKDSGYHLNTKKFYIYNNDLYHFKWYSNIIYKVHNNKITPCYRLNFSQSDFHKGEIQELFRQINANRYDDDKLTSLIAQNFQYIIRDMHENDNYIFITLNRTDKNFENQYIIYDKRKCKAYRFNPDKEGVVWGNWNDCLSSKYYTTFVDAIEKECINYKKLSTNNKLIYDKVGENDNPIIVRYKFKENIR